MMLLLRIKTLLRCLILPPAGPLLLAAIGLLLLKRRPRLARLCLAAAFASLWICSTPLVAETLTRLAESYPALDLRQPIHAQAIVILGGGGQREWAPEYGGAMAGPVLLERLSYGAYLSRKTGLPVLVSGFRIEATAMHDTLVRNFGLEPRWTDAAAYDTFQNARNSVRMLETDGVRRIVLVTHSTHMGRAVEEFRAAGIEVVPAPTGMQIPIERLSLWSFVPVVDALAASTAAIYELIGNAARVALAVSHLRRH
jgi:uncharacterized SAM-binding protein YcdF (DUF218 family)